MESTSSRPRRLPRCAWLAALCLAVESGGAASAQGPGAAASPAAAPVPSAPASREGPANVDLGVNLGPLAYSGMSTAASELPFVDLARLCKRFDAVLAGDSYPGGSSVTDYTTVFTDLDGDGYVREPIPHLGFVVGTHIAHGLAAHYPGGTYVVTFEGVGTLSLTGDVTNVVQVDPNRYEVDVTPTHRGIVLRITSSAGAPLHVRNLRVVPADLAAADGAPLQTFRPDYLERLGDLLPKALRFLNWKAVLAKTKPVLADEADIGHYTYDRFAEGGGVPHALCRELAAEVGAGAWLNVPYDADFLGYVVPLAIDYADWSLQSGRPVYVEYGNEVWNGLFGRQFCFAVDAIGGYPPCDPANPPALDAGLAHDIAVFLATYSRAIFDLFAAEFAARGIEDRLVRVVAGRVNSYTYNQDLLDTLGGPDEVDLLAMPTYFGQLTVANLGWDVLQTISDAELVAYLHGVIGGGPYLNLRDFLQGQRALVDAFNASTTPPDDVQLAAYEGGQSLFFEQCDCPAFCPTKTDPQCLAEMTLLTQRFHALNRSAAMLDLYYDLLGTWEEASAVDGGPGGLWMQFVFTKQFLPAAAGSWGLLEYYDSDRSVAPKYHALQASQSD